MNALIDRTTDWLSRNSRLVTALFFGFFLVLGLSVYTDYGVSFDESWGRENGIINAKYIAEKLAPGLLEGKNYCPGCLTLRQYPDHDHGPVFEVAATFLEFVLGITDMGAIFKLRHLCSFLLFYISCFFFYLLLHQRFRKPLVSLVGVIMLVLSPRIFADSFFNAKDLPFLSMGIISGYTMIRFLRKPSFTNAFWHALACGLTLDIRILGLLFPAATVVFSLLDLSLIRPNGFSAKRSLPALFVFLALFAGFAIAFWPYLWESPVNRFLHVLARSSSYPWNGDLLYLGSFIKAPEIPWHYLPVWFFITTPILYSVLFLVGVGFILANLVRSHFRLYRTPEEQQDLAMLGFFLVPVAAAIILKLVLYDGWRHFFFIYPWFLYVAVVGIYNLYVSIQHVENGRRRFLLRNALLVAWIWPVSYLAYWMFHNHPHQNVYFSIYNTDRVRKIFELDYWGLSYKQGLEFALANTDQPKIKVFVPFLPGYLAQYMLPPAQRKRLVYVQNMWEADYFLTEYRWHPADFPFDEVFQIRVDRIKIFSVYKKPDRNVPIIDFKF